MHIKSARVAANNICETKTETSEPASVVGLEFVITGESVNGLFLNDSTSNFQKGVSVTT